MRCAETELTANALVEDEWQLALLYIVSRHHKQGHAPTSSSSY